jgi:tRNA(Ile)-lysidine synthase
MPRPSNAMASTWVRPWLDHSRDSDRGLCARHHRLRYIDDDSNADTRFARNRLRLKVWPALERSLSAGRRAAGRRAAAWAAEASCLAELAAIDLRSVAMPRAARRKTGAPQPAVAANALRAWLRATVGTPPAQRLVLRLQQELPGTGPGTVARCRAANSCVVSRHLCCFTSDAAGCRRARRARHSLSILRAGRYALPGWGGELHRPRVPEGGVPLAWLAHLELRAREGGEQFQAGHRPPARSLKKQFQAAGVPEWERTARSSTAVANWYSCPVWGSTRGCWAARSAARCSGSRSRRIARSS